MNRLWLSLFLSVVVSIKYPPVFPFPFERVKGNTQENLIYCAVNASVFYDDIYDLLQNESEAFMEILRNSEQTSGMPPELSDMMDDSLVWDALECCTHPTSSLGITFDYGCPSGVSKCVFDPRLDYKKNVVGLFRPAGCVPVESPRACYSRQAGGGVLGSCPENKSVCCYARASNYFMGCAHEEHECCEDKICPYGYTCCRLRGHGGGGSVCCPRYGASCYDHDYFAHGVNESVVYSGPVGDPDDPIHYPTKLSEHFNMTYGYHGCLPTPGGELGPVQITLYRSDPFREFDFDTCLEGKERATYLTRPYLRRVARTEGDLHSDGYSNYLFDGIDLDDYDLTISEDAQRFGGEEDLDFIECGRQLCYGMRDYCVYRYRNDSYPYAHRVINVTTVLEIYESELELANANLTDDIEPPATPNFEWLEKIDAMCSQYNDTYLQQLIDDGIYEGLVTHKFIDPQFYYLLPPECLMWDEEYIVKSHPLGCCPKNSTPCASHPYSLSPNLSAEWPEFHSLYDPMLACAMEGETCCGGSVCPAGYKCCDIRFTVRGLPALPLDGSFNSTDHVTGGLPTRLAILFDILNNASYDETSYISESFDVRHKCCPTYSFCCQADLSFTIFKNTGRRFTYFCSVDPFCKIPIWNTGRYGHAGGVVHDMTAYPAQMRSDDASLDHNSDGVFDMVTDILETYKRRRTPVGSTSGSHLTDVKCSGTVDTEGGTGAIMSCGQLSFSTPPSTSRRRHPRTKRHIPNYPPPPEHSPIVSFDILGTIVTIDTTDIFSIASPLGHHFASFRDYTQQLVLESYFGTTFFGFPPEEVYENT